VIVHRSSDSGSVHDIPLE
jgi:hypothetical protein